MCVSTETEGIIDTEKAAGCKLHSPRLRLSKDKLITGNPSAFPYPHPYPTRVWATRHTNDWVLKVCISGSLTLT